jgi:hypothetical protein
MHLPQANGTSRTIAKLLLSFGAYCDTRHCCRGHAPRCHRSKRSARPDRAVALASGHFRVQVGRDRGDECRGDINPIQVAHDLSGILDLWSYTSLCHDGDFNNNGTLDVEDIDLLSNVARLGTDDPDYDLNDDQLVDQLDRGFWVETLRKTYFGDSNLDGEFNTADLVQVFQAGLYEDAIDDNAGWASGDWNGDADFNSRDLVLAFQSGGYEAGPRPAAVPEPSASLLLLIGIAIAARRWA